MSFDFFDAAVMMEPQTPVAVIEPEGEFFVFPPETPSGAALLTADEGDDMSFDWSVVVEPSIKPGLHFDLGPEFSSGLQGSEVDVDGDGLPDADIVITGTRPSDYATSTPVAPWGDDSASIVAGEVGGEPDRPDDYDCEKDAAALKAASEINRDTLPNIPGQAERGAIIYRDASGNVVAGQIAVGTDIGVSPSTPPGVGYLDILGQIHSHPLAPRSGNPNADALYDFADQYPSQNDWANIGRIADEVLAAGGNPDQLSLYIIDAYGFLREFSYKDRHIYDRSIDLMLRVGLTPPPLPDSLFVSLCGNG